MMPASTSPAIDQGAAAGASTDQRGQSRVFDVPNLANAAGGDGADIGAVELQAGEYIAPPTTSAKKKCKKKKKKSSAESAKKTKKKCKKKKKKKGS